MKNIGKRIIGLSLLAAIALGYLGLSGANLVLNPNAANANTAPPGTLQNKLMGSTDYVWNWDYGSKTDETDRYRVDWAMRFVFKENADIDYVKDRLDGRWHDPSISPNLNNVLAHHKFAYVDDGHDHQGSYWDEDKGLKNHTGCFWNFGHMRFYANGDSNYNPTLGYYVVATLHRDHEALHCDNQFSSLESHEDTWIDRIEDNLGPDTDYDWTVTENATSWQNGISGTRDIGGGNHTYQSDGWGHEVTVPGDD